MTRRSFFGFFLLFQRWQRLPISRPEVHVECKEEMFPPNYCRDLFVGKIRI